MDKRYSSWLLENIILGEVIRLHIGVNMIGRNNSSHIRVNSNFASRNHAEIIVSEDEKTIIIRDLNSSNGIYVNHNSTTRAILKKGDLIGVGVRINYNIATIEHPLFVLKTAPMKCYVEMQENVEPKSISLEKANNLDSSSVSKSETAINFNILNIQRNNSSNVVTPITTDVSINATKLNSSNITPKPADTMNCMEKSPSSNLNILNDDLILISEDEEPNIAVVKNDIASPKTNGNTLLAGQCIVLLTEESSSEETMDKEIKNEKLDDNKFQLASIVPQNNISDNNECGNNKIAQQNNMSDNNEYAEKEEEEFILTQKAIDDIKAEFLTDDYNSFENDINTIPEALDNSLGYENFDSVIIDDDYDADLEEKVEIWSNKLLSQNVMEQSQIFEEDNCEEPISTEIECEFKNTTHQTLIDEILFPLRQKLESHKKKKVFKKKKKSGYISISSDDESIKSKKRKQSLSKRTKRKRVVEDKGKIATETKEATEKRARLNSTDEDITQVSNETRETQQNRTTENNITDDQLSVSNDNEHIKPNKIEETPQNHTRRNTITDDKIYNSSKDNKLEEIVKKVAKKNNSFLEVINPPHLPIHKGKHRGISAATASTTDFGQMLKSCEIDNLTKKNNVEKRKAMLKDIAEKSKEKKEKCESEDQKKKEVMKVKNTKVNRGAFLTNDVPKTICRKKSDDNSKLETSTNTALAQLKRRNSICGSLAERKEKVEAREKRTTNKITFASMQKNIVESFENQRRLEQVSTLRSCLFKTVQKTVRRVRFAEERNEIYYIEPRIGATKKVDKKDAELQPSYNARRDYMRRQFPKMQFHFKVCNNY
ncbi:uncharacterized protein LOC119681621 [Teleopsis dalmanni]|uniref:uncharacterized protein LOC119681621 n=1 Tax=Teleopsis dalmanni TaxID=139649 RepID=UPI0018CEF6F9|nr:uncharacterized protein LOC119681621 [Teleopsis dalmanni]